MKRLFLILLASIVLIMPEIAYAQGGDDDKGILVRVNGDVTLDADEQANVVAAINGDALIAGSADFVLVVDGKARLAGARVKNLVVVRGQADLAANTLVQNDVWLFDSDFVRTQGVRIDGSVNRGINYSGGLEITRGVGLIFSFFSFVAFTITVVLSGLVAAAVAARQVRSAGSVLTGEIGKTLLAAVIIWIALPLVAVAFFATLVGIPTSLGIFVLALPMLGFLGYLVAGIRIGDAVLAAVRGRVEATHPYIASVVGLLLLQAVGWVPVAGAIVILIAGVVGGGSVTLAAWRAFRSSGAT